MFIFAKNLRQMANSCERKETPKGLKAILRSWYFWKPAMGIIIGGTAGFLYYYYTGCTTGNCSIASSPYYSTIMGSMFGLFITNRPCGSC